MKLSREIKEPSLQVTYLRGRALAAYYYLPGRTSARSCRTRCVDPGLVIDFDRKGKPIGIEITAPSAITEAKFNRLLKELGLAPIKRGELWPLRAA